MLTVDGEWRKTRLFRSHEQAELGWRNCGHGSDVRAEGVGANDRHRTGVALVGWTRVRPTPRDPNGYDHAEPATRAAEREGINRLQAGDR